MQLDAKAIAAEVENSVRQVQPAGRGRGGDGSRAGRFLRNMAESQADPGASLGHRDVHSGSRLDCRSRAQGVDQGWRSGRKPSLPLRRAVELLMRAMAARSEQFGSGRD